MFSMQLEASDHEADEEGRNSNMHKGAVKRCGFDQN